MIAFFRAYMSIVWALYEHLWASYEHHMSIIYVHPMRIIAIYLHQFPIDVCAFQNLSFKFSRYTNLMMPNTWFTMSMWIAPMKWWIQSGISMVNTINSTVNNIWVFSQSCFQLLRIEQLPPTIFNGD